MNKLIKLILDGSDVEESVYVLTPQFQSASGIYGILPTVWGYDEISLWNWDAERIDLDTVSADTLTGGMWLFVSKSDSIPQRPDLWFRCDQARRLARSMCLQLTSPIISGVRLIQRMDAPAETSSLAFTGGALCLWGDRCFSVHSGADLRNLLAHGRHPFSSADSLSFMGDCFIGVEQGELRAFSISEGRIVDFPESAVVDFAAKRVFFSGCRIYVIDRDEQLHHLFSGTSRQVLFPVSPISAISQIVDCPAGGTLLAAGRELFLVNPGTGAGQRLCCSCDGSMLRCGWLGSVAAVLDGRQILLIDTKFPGEIEAFFSATGHGRPLAAPAAIATNGVDELYLLDGGEIFRYRIFFMADGGQAAETRYPHVLHSASLPEAAFLLTGELLDFCWRLRMERSLNASERRDLFLDYAREQNLIFQTSGLVAISLALQFLGQDGFVAFDAAGLPRLFLHEGGQLKYLEGSLQPRPYDGAEPSALDEIAVKELLDLAEEKEQSHDGFMGMLTDMHKELRSRPEPAPTLDRSYQEAVVEGGYNIPLRINEEVRGIVTSLVSGKTSDEERARAVFDWFLENIAYGKERRMRERSGYLDALEVFTHKEGVCGEMAALYVCMARLAGLKSQIVYVEEDCHGSKVHHACAGVRLGERLVLVDPAYHQFDVGHRRYRVIRDEDFIQDFRDRDRPAASQPSVTGT